MSATVRFTKVIDEAGKPEIHLFWGDPASDTVFQRALKSHRVMTIRQENVGSKKDFGLVGFSQETSAQFLIFPRSLKAFEGQRVVGINYEIFDPPPRPRSPSADHTVKKKAPRKSVQAAVDTPRGSKAPTSRAIAAKNTPTPPKSDADDTVSHALPVKENPHPPSEVISKKGEATVTPKTALDSAQLLKDVRKAMAELEAGKTVLAFRRLEKLADVLAAIP